MIKAVVFDLDDTLYPEMDYVRSGYRAVADEIEKLYGIKNAQDELLLLFAERRENVFNRFLDKHSLLWSKKSVEDLVKVYRTHAPQIKLSQDVIRTLKTLRHEGLKLGIITDGLPCRQRGKIKVLGLDALVDSIIVTDELGGEQFRKPHPLAFETIGTTFGVLPEEMLYVGDNPQKDFAIKKFLPVITAQLCGKNLGLYSGMPYLYGIKSDFEIEKINELCSSVRGDKK